MKKQITFLLGAGCEGRGQLGLPSGNSFKRDTIVAKDVTELIYAINKKNVPEIKNGTIIAHNSSSVLYQTICEYGMNRFVFSDADKHTIESYINLDDENNNFDKNEKDVIRKAFSKIYREQFYDAIKKTDTATDELSDNVKFFLDHACFYSFIDSLFNCLRKPEKYRKEVNRIIKLYFAAYLSVIKKLFDASELTAYNELIKSDFSIHRKRCELANLVQTAQKRISTEKQGVNDLYYNMIKEYAHTHDDTESGIVTTNYTDFSETVTGTEKERIAFVHGKLNLFENTKSKAVAEIESFSDDDFIFPFIFVQSGVKPIVNRSQIHEFEKASQMIMNVDEVLVLGYGINSDDEHISNLLRERVRIGKRLTCFLHENTPENRSAVENELQCTERIMFEDSANFMNVLKSY